MNKTIKILLLLMFFMLAFSICTFAADNPETTIVAEPINDTIDQSPDATETSSVKTMDFFTAENILAIIVITVGVVLIFLGVAIFIRLR